MNWKNLLIDPESIVWNFLLNRTKILKKYIITQTFSTKVFKNGNFFTKKVVFNFEIYSQREKAYESEEGRKG